MPWTLTECSAFVMYGSLDAMTWKSRISGRRSSLFGSLRLGIPLSGFRWNIVPSWITMRFWKWLGRRGYLHAAPALVIPDLPVLRFRIATRRSKCTILQPRAKPSLSPFPLLTSKKSQAQMRGRDGASSPSPSNAVQLGNSGLVLSHLIDSAHWRMIMTTTTLCKSSSISCVRHFKNSPCSNLVR